MYNFSGLFLDAVVKGLCGETADKTFSILYYVSIIGHTDFNFVESHYLTVVIKLGL